MCSQSVGGLLGAEATLLSRVCAYLLEVTKYSAVRPVGCSVFTLQPCCSMQFVSNADVPWL